jgi:diguanylate cyclase (GGDEF)-like protein
MTDKGKILVVDDTPASLKLLSDLLKAEGYEVRSAISGELALHSAESAPPELILLDIRMPIMDGYEVCRRLKAQPVTRDVPVIFVSAAQETDEKVRAFREGGIDYITKPFQKEEVLARVKTQIALSHYIQEMKKATEALRKSEENLKLAQSIARLGYWEWDLKSGQFSCSGEMYRILGLESPMTMSNHEALLHTVHPDDRERVANYLSNAQSGDNSDIEYRVISSDGQTRVLHGRAEKFASGAGMDTKIIGTVQDVHESNQVRMRGIIQDITEQKELQSRLEKLANTDDLTGCTSRRHFMERAETELLRVRRYGREMSMLMLDLDHFKNINDQYGHEVGDTALRIFVQVCQKLLRDVDVMGRLGGEEFAIMLPETSSAQAIKVAERACQAVAAAEVSVQNAPPVHFTTSIGVASLAAGDLRVDALLNRADRALYKAKEAGRNQIQFADELN